ncbi:hypothetical protein BJF90_36055 [Pseudonocardia sp. CNS-004]|nr:hypothetical protein BJF90_36055 [Pseudonocardia sp. CNS-004]
MAAPGAHSSRVLLYAHGGGYTMGSPDGYRDFGFSLSSATGATVHLIDYRLAPEHPFPAAVDDVLAVYRAVLANTGVRDVFLGGDSAGGGLVLGSAMAIRDLGMPIPHGVVGISPLTDITASGESMDRNRAHDAVITREAVLGGPRRLYLCDRPAAEHPYASPHHGLKTGLPPLLLMAGSTEALLDDSVRFHESVLAVGGCSQLVVAPDMVHIWPVFSSFLPEGRAAITTIGEFVRRRTGSPA